MTGWAGTLFVSAWKILLWTVFLLFAIILIYYFGVLTYLRVSGRKPESIGVRLSYPGGFQVPAFVGAGGQYAPLAIRENTEGITVSVSWWTAVVTIIATGFFGPGLLFVSLRSPQLLNSHPPLPFVIIAVLIIGVCCISFVVTLYKSLFGRTRLNVSRQSILCLSGRREVRRLGIENIAHIGSRAFPYAVSNRITVPNYVLYARLNGGEDVPLCLTSAPDQISLIERHVARMGYQIDVQGPP